MSEDFGALYGDMVVKATEAGLPNIVLYLEKLARLTNETLRENQSLMDENTRLHGINDKLHTHLAEERKRLKPDGPLVSRKVLLMVVELLEDAGVIGDPWDDTASNLRYEIKQVTQHEEV